MENPYNGNYYQPYTPTPQQTPVPPVYDGNQTMASLSLVMGILALLSLCCMPFFTVHFRRPGYFIFLSFQRTICPFWSGKSRHGHWY